jgi:hypothetical protein
MRKSHVYLCGAAVALVLSGCQSFRPPCGGADTRPWKVLSNPPSDAAALIQLAEANPITKGSMVKFSKEIWFGLGDKHLMLCRGSFVRDEDEYGVWWQFDRSE